MTDYSKRIGSIMRSEACVVEMNVYMEEGRYIRHKLNKDVPFPHYLVRVDGQNEFKKFYYRAVCKRCGMVSFIKPKEFFLWRPKETG